jgi:hypothetical protein
MASKWWIAGANPPYGLFFDTLANKSFVSLETDGVTHTLAIGSRYFIEWLSYAYYKSTSGEGISGRSASEAAMRQASFALAGIAKHEGQQQIVHLRVSENNGCRYHVCAAMPTNVRYAVMQHCGFETVDC